MTDEAKALIALVLRNGPIESIHAGKSCPTCYGREEYSHVSNDEIKRIMQYAVSRLHRLLLLRDTGAARYETEIAFGSQYTAAWDNPTDFG